MSAIGIGERRSTCVQSTSDTAPAARRPIVCGASQPHVFPSETATSGRASPIARSGTPRTSTLPPGPRGPGTNFQAATDEITASAATSQNTDSKPTWSVSSPPITRPSAAPAPVSDEIRPIRVPVRRAGLS